jgi:predicted phosphodiesterase
MADSMRKLHLILLSLLGVLLLGVRQGPFNFPLKSNSVKFAAIGDMGTGEAPQMETAERMNTSRKDFPFDFVIMLGDNIYGGSSPKDFEKKFERPYKPLLDGGVKFYASLGNHDNPNERLYKPFNMNGVNYYTFKKGNVRFFALDSNYMDAKQLAWLEKELQDAANSNDWKICFFHHPLYSSGKTHGSSIELRALIEPLFIKYGVDAVFSGHDHVYEHVKPENGIYYFTEGSSGQLREGGLATTGMTQKGFDTDRTFMLVEVAGDVMYFEAVSRTGTIVDSGELRRPVRAAPGTATK